MICAHCGRESANASHVCPHCGQYMGAQKPARLPSDQEAVVQPPRPERSKRRPKKRRRRPRHSEKYYFRARVINWAWVWFALGVVVFGLMVGAYAFLKLNSYGQVILGRMGRDTSAQALWTVGTEYFDRGDIPRAIQTYEKAAEQEPNMPGILDELFNLAEAYEAAGRQDEALAIYQRIAADAKPNGATADPRRITAYRNAIRILTNQERTALATDMMAEAYENTGDVSFFKERSQLVPKAPVASIPGGSYMLTQTVEFLSEEGHDIFYTDGEGELPEAGKLYTGPIVITEGVYVFRAVCVSQDLMSDEMSVKYTVRLPVPMAPRANVQPGEYSKPFRVKLRNVSDDKEVRFYYTIDGTRPTENSPEFKEGDPGILLPTGNVTLRAIAVNRYGKISNEMSTGYRIKGAKKKYFNETDHFGKFAVMSTPLKDFTAQFGAPIEEKTVEDDAMTGVCTALTYPWGEARFCQGREGNLLYYVSTSEPSMTGPRSTRIGMTVSDIAQNFRDMGQVAGPKGDRGIYYESNKVYAAYIVPSDNPLDGTLEYWFQTNSGKLNGTNTLTYTIENGKAVRITYAHTDKYLPISH